MQENLLTTILNILIKPLQSETFNWFKQISLEEEESWEEQSIIMKLHNNGEPYVMIHGLLPRMLRYFAVL